MNEPVPNQETVQNPSRNAGLQDRLQQLRRRHTKGPHGGLGGPDLGTPESRPQEVSIFLVALFDILRKRLWLVLLLSGVVGVLLYQWSKSRPKQYRSSALIEVVTRSPRVFTNIRDVISFHLHVRRFYATQKVILHSNDIAKKALNSVSWVLRSPGFYGLDKIKDKELQRKRMKQMRPNAHLLLKARTTVVAIRKSSLFRITVQDTDPHRAGQLALALAESYKEHNKQFRLRATNNAYVKIKAQRDRFAKRYKGLDQKLVAFRQSNNLLTTSLNDRRNLAFKQLEEVNKRLTNVMLRRIELESMLRPFLRMKRRKQQIDASFPPLLTHRIYWAMSERQSDIRLNLERYKARYKSKHPTVIQIKRKLKQITKILDDQKGIVFGSYLQRLSASRREEKRLRRKVYIARSRLQRIEKINLQFGRMQEQKKEIKRSLQFLNRRFFEVQLLKDATATNARIVERPQVPKSPFSPRVMRDTILGTFLAFLGIFALFFLIELLDRSIRSIEDVELRTGLVPLGEVPLFSTKKKSGRDLLYNPDRPLSQMEESIRTVRTNLLFMTSDVGVRKFLFTSPSPREGKTFITANMAIGIAHMGKKTVLIDTDMRRPRVHKALELDYDRSRGASSVMIGQHSLDEALIDSGYPNLWVLPCGPIPPSPTELIQTDGFFRMLADLEDRFDVILFDSPPVGHVADAAVLSNYVDGVVLISASGSTSWNALQGAARRIESVGGRLLGCILNKFSHKDRRSYYYGTYGYYSSYRYSHYGYSSKEEELAAENS